ncbi:MAG: phosphoglucomutase [Firmicutes bacterium HGW-Firmicutes-16]|nr:MAG: phosphoglucomutase [Firmicutes bacterium HGW-Firmicutes-16]
MNDYMEEYRRWMDSPALSESEWKELDEIASDEEEIKSRFFAPLEFGTAGLRGIMGMGLNRMNRHVIRHATQAFASVICAEGEEAMKNGVVICYDCRENSELFARAAASVMAANGIFVRIFDALRPTPELSYAIRSFGATAGINVTASHNPREYNGYKVYWADGAQLPPKHAQAIADAMAHIDIFTGIKRMIFSEAVEAGLIETIGAETDEAFLENVLSQSIDRDAVARVADKFKVVYTPFHGAGYRLVPEALRRLGIKNIIPVPQQMVIDGTFPTVKSPNPEDPAGFYLAIELAKRESCDLIIGTDPDSDRVGIMVRDDEGEFVTMSGNQTGVLLLDYIITARKRAGTLPENAAVVKTIVTTEMAREVAQQNGVHIDDTFTGFKFMAEKVAEYEKADSYSYILAYEESYGYMIGDYVRDKDAVTASMLLAEMAAYYFGKGLSLLQALDSLYEKYGYFAEKTLNLVMPGIDGLENMRRLMSRLRENPPVEISDVKVLRERDYASGKIIVPGLGVVGKTHIVGSNVLYFELEDDTSFIVRPSGTEPKIKIYILVSGNDKRECSSKIDKYVAYAQALR